MKQLVNPYSSCKSYYQNLKMTKICKISKREFYNIFYANFYLLIWKLKILEQSLIASAGILWCLFTLHKMAQSKPFIWVGRNISALVGYMKNLRPLYEVQLLETFQIQQLDLHYKQYQKKVTETKVEKIPNGTLKMAFFAPWFLGFTTIIIKY